MTIRDIAKRAQVSPATVSRYFSGNEAVSLESSRRIEEVLQTTSYRPRGYESKAPQLIGILVEHFHYGFYHEVLEHVIESQAKQSIRVVCIPCGTENVTTAVNIITKLRLDGAITLETTLDPMILDALEAVKARLVFCGEASLSPQGIKVHCNDLMAAYAGTRYLLSLGHRKIAFLSDHADSINCSFQRIVGCTKALQESGIPWDDDCVYYTGITYEGGYQSTMQLLKSHQRATAIFAFGDEMAFGAIAALLDSGLRVPEDMSVLGFDDLPLATRMRPQLTTVHQPIADFVQRSLECLRNPANYDCQNSIVLPCSITERQTCAAVKPATHLEEMERMR